MTRRHNSFVLYDIKQLFKKATPYNKHIATRDDLEVLL